MLFYGSVETCPQAVDIVETPLYFLIILFPQPELPLMLLYIYKLLGCVLLYDSYFHGTLVD
ncbi:hypothetical protein BAVI_24423 [Neobacillus vireti LMG 21834]|uniref:Uncharacterized protein n=1 Tax=Neobacillus vireti LMG 21834 TaxID=1131730 RepID=A0AB94IG40_9BACI|nr:hypothetical protein BAVI_24423 [Neobacillus vireti LMG 21834]